MPARPETGPANDDPAQILNAMAEALAMRSMPDCRDARGALGQLDEGWSAP